MHLTKSKEARTVRDWESVEEESHLAISSGADSSPQVTKSYIHTNFLLLLGLLMSKTLPMHLFTNILFE